MLVLLRARRCLVEAGPGGPSTHLHDATMVKCLVNAYHNNEANIRAAIDKLMGQSDFKGTPNELVWASKWQARL